MLNRSMVCSEKKYKIKNDCCSGQAWANKLFDTENFTDYTVRPIKLWNRKTT